MGAPTPSVRASHAGAGPTPLWGKRGGVVRDLQFGQVFICCVNRVQVIDTLTQIRRFSHITQYHVVNCPYVTIDVPPPDLRATHAKNSHALASESVENSMIEFERARREGARAAAAHPATRRHHEPILRLPSALAESTLGASGTGGAAAADGGRPGGGSCMSVGGCNGCIGGCGG